MNNFHNKLAMALPDIPLWLETRSMLLNHPCEVFGFSEDCGLSFVVYNPETRLISVVGRPNHQAIQQAVAYDNRPSILLSSTESSSHVALALPKWNSSVATLHRLRLGNAPDLPEIPEGAVRLLAPSEIETLKHVPTELSADLTLAARHSPIAVTLAGGVPVSFCYAAAQTESLWDISIDTLVRHRKRGYAALCVTYMIDYMHHKGKQPVWGTENWNVPSMKLAAKLGFVRVEQIILFQP